jgi:hypothetical protein
VMIKKITYKGKEILLFISFTKWVLHQSIMFVDLCLRLMFVDDRSCLWTLKFELCSLPLYYVCQVVDVLGEMNMTTYSYGIF